MAKYRHPVMRQWRDQQVRYAPRDVRLRQIERAEEWLAELSPDEHISYSDLSERLTDGTSSQYPDLVIEGHFLLHDLRRLIEDLCDSLKLPKTAFGTDLLTLEEVTERFRVSAKTIARWRDQGLSSRRFVENGRRRLGFLRASLEKFAARNSEKVRRGSEFRQMSDDERHELIRRARRLAMHGACQTEIARRLARKLARSPETIRYTLKKFDRDYPEVAVFPNATTPLTEEHKRQLFRAFQRGVPVDVLARDWQRTRTSIYRIVAEVRARDILSRPLDFMPSDVFNDPSAEAEILGPAPERQGRASVTKAPPGLPPYLASLYAIPLLTREEEVYYFRKMNYLKSRAAELRETLDPAKPSAKVMDQIERWLDEANEVKNFLIRSNLRLVVSIAKKHLKPNVSFFEMVSDGNMSLIRAIEKFDYTRGFKFSTYASWAIMKNYARSIPAEHQLLERFRTGHDEVFQSSSDSRTTLWNDELVNSRQREAIMSILGELEDREREILVHRYGLNEGTQPQTLEQVGQRFGVTKERIRQLEARALRKLRKIASETHLEIPGI